MKTKIVLLVWMMTIGMAGVESAWAFYNPQTGRWLSRDPIDEKGGINLYVFAQNDALNHFDVDGRFTGSKCPLCGEWYQGIHKCKPAGLSASGCASCPEVQQAINLVNKALSSGACRKWFKDHGHDFTSGLPKATVTCYGKDKGWCACGFSPTWTFPGMGIGFCKSDCGKYGASGLASLLVHELAHHFCTWGPGRESCAESGQDACASQLVK